MPSFSVLSQRRGPEVADHEQDQVAVIGAVLGTWNGEVSFSVPIPPALGTSHRAWRAGPSINAPTAESGPPPFLRCGPLASGVGRHMALSWDGAQGNWATLTRCWPLWPSSVSGLVPARDARIHPMSYVMDAIVRKVSALDAPGCYSGFGLSACLVNSSDSNIAYPADRRFPIVGILGDAAGGFVLASVDTPDGGTAVATDRDPTSLDPGAIPAIAAPGAGYFRASLKIIPAGPSSLTRIVGFINGIAIGALSGANRRCRGAGTGSLVYNTELAWFGAGHTVTFGGVPIDVAFMRTYWTYDLSEALG